MTWILLIINLATIAVAARKRVLPYTVLSAIFTVLVAGQAFQMEADFSQSSVLNYAFSRISYRGFLPALWYAAIVSGISLILAFVGKGYTRYQHPEPRYTFQPSIGIYWVILGTISTVAAYLVFGVVGLSAFIRSSRPGNQPGATLFITLMSIGLFPLLFKLFTRCRVTRFDVLCYALTLLVTAGFSRLHVIIYIIVLLLALYYERGWANRQFGFRLFIRIFGTGAAAVIFFFVVGAIRDAENFTHGTFSDLVKYNLDHPETSLLSLQYTNRVSIEGMSGLAGAFTAALENPGQTDRDYGLSITMNGIAQMLPSVIKAQLQDYLVTIDAFYWYKKAAGNVSPGIESSFVSFGWLGAVIYPLLFFATAWKFPMWVLSRQLSPPIKLTCFMWLGCGVFFVRGSWPDWVAFSLSYAVIICLVWVLFSVCFSPSGLAETA